MTEGRDLLNSLLVNVLREQIAPLIRYLTVGIANTAFSLTLIYCCMSLGVDIYESNAVGYAAGIVLSFFLNRRWTFRHSGSIGSSFVRWLIVLAAAYTANLAAVHVAFSRFYMDPFVSQLFGIPPYVLLGYFGSRFFAFAPIGLDVNQLTRR